MDKNYLADLLYPNIKILPKDIEARYQKRQLPDDAKVTRFAPSPTGFVHFGGLFPTMIGECLARQSGGVFYLRIEDTDSKREVEGAETDIINSYADYNINFDEGVTIGGEKGDYGPYRQSQRVEIYQTYAKELIRQGKAYPCFCTEEELNEIRAKQEELKLNLGYYGEWAIYRDASIEKIEAELKKGKSFVLRFYSTGNINNKIKFTDLVKGDIEITENDIDHVLLKSNGIPTYHFAHVVDDYLMQTTHVIRGEEWLSSLPFHIQLFNAFGFKLPKYLHISQLMKMEEGGSKKKLSKRDKGAGLSYYKETGYAPECVREYFMILLNSNFEEWRTLNPNVDINEFQFSISKMSTSGSLFDFDKLNDVSKNTISRMTAQEVYSHIIKWTKEYDSEFATILEENPKYAIDILSIGRGGPKPRKDIAVWSDVKPYMGFFYDKYFKVEDTYPEQFDKSDIKSTLQKYSEVYSEDDDTTEWFGKIKYIATELGFAADMKLYKKNMSAYRGSVGDISMFIRLAVTGKLNSPDMYEVMRILGKDKVVERMKNAENMIL